MIDFAALPFDELEVGASATTRGRTITESDVCQFSNLTWDTHPWHTDEPRAAAGPFGGRVAHGMLVLSYAVGLLDMPPDHVVAMRRLSDVTFKRPVRIGTTIHAVVRIAALQPLDDHTGLVAIRLRVLDGYDRLSVLGTLEVLWRRTDRASQPPEQLGDDEAAVLCRPAGF